MINKKKYKEAIDYAYKLHLNQKRKGTNIPYFFHLVSVSTLVIENNGTTEEVIAGLLHDAVEDQGGLKTLKYIKSKFGNKVAKIVEECSDSYQTPKPPWIERKKLYIKKMSSKLQSSLLVSLCDKYHNASCIVNDHHRVGKKLWKRFNAKPKEIVWYYESLSKSFNRHLKGYKVLKNNYASVVKEMKRLK
mgnify:FL=1